MHEMSLCESILDILKEQAQAQAFSRVERVCLEVGPFSGVEVEAMRFGFDVVAKGSLAENAVLEIVETEASAWCMDCSAPVKIEQRYGPCPQCGSHRLQVTGGDELRIRELEVV